MDEQILIKFGSESDVKPLADAISKIFSPFLKVLPKIGTIPEEISRLSSKLSEDIMSGVPERVVKASKKILKDTQKDLIKMMTDVEANRSKMLAQNLSANLEKVNALSQQGVPAMIKDGKVIIKSEKQIIKEQKQLILVEKKLAEDEKSLLSARKKFAEGDGSAANKIKEFSGKVGSGQTKRDKLQTGLGDQSSGGESFGDFVPDFIKEPFMELNESITSLKNGVLQTVKIFKGLGKVLNKSWKLAVKMYKLGLKGFALAVKKFVLDKATLAIAKLLLVIAKFALIVAALQLAMNPYVLIAAAVLAAIGTLYYFRDEIANAGVYIYNGLMKILDDVGNFFSNIWKELKSEAKTLMNNIIDFVSDTFKTLINGLISLLNKIPFVDIPLIETSDSKSKVAADTSSIEKKNVDIANSSGFQSQSGVSNVIIDNKSSSTIVTPTPRVIRVDPLQAGSVAIA